MLDCNINGDLNIGNLQIGLSNELVSENSKFGKKNDEILVVLKL